MDFTPNVPYPIYIEYFLIKKQILTVHFIKVNKKNSIAVGSHR